MKYIDCPGLGRRPVGEFHTGGVLEAEPAELGAHSAGRWVFGRTGVPRERTEWWYHLPSRLWFRVRRDTATDAIVTVTAARGVRGE